MQVNSKYTTIKNLLDNYLKTKDSVLQDEIKNNLKKLQINDIVKLFFNYSSYKYVNNYDVKPLLNLFISEIISKLDTVSLIKAIDLYIMFFNKTLVVEDVLIANKNILSVMSFDISNTDYIEKNIEKKNISKEKFIQNCKKQLAIYANSTSINELIKSYFEELSEKILACIELKIQKLEGIDKKYLIQNLNTRFQNASLQLLELSECFDNRQKLLRTDSIDLLEYNLLKGKLVVYEKFRNDLLEKKDIEN